MTLNRIFSILPWPIFTIEDKLVPHHAHGIGHLAVVVIVVVRGQGYWGDGRVFLQIVWLGSNCGGEYHNIIQIYNSALWDWQYFEEYFAQNIIMDLNNIMTLVIPVVACYYLCRDTYCNNILLKSSLFTDESSIGCSDNEEHKRLYLVRYDILIK